MSDDDDMMRAMLDGDDAAGQRVIDRMTLKGAIVGHRTFFCPITGLCLDQAKAVMVEVVDAEGRIVGSAGPWMGEMADLLRAETDEARNARVRASLGREDVTVRLLDGAVLFGKKRARK